MARAPAFAKASRGAAGSAQAIHQTIIAINSAFVG